MSRHDVLCGGAVGAGGGGAGLPTTLGTPGITEILPLALLAALFVGAGVWIFRRFGNSAPRVAPGEAGSVVEPAEERLAGPDGRRRQRSVGTPVPGALRA